MRLFVIAKGRGLELKSDKVNNEVTIVRVYHYKVLKDLIDKGFDYGSALFGLIGKLPKPASSNKLLL